MAISSPTPSRKIILKIKKKNLKKKSKKRKKEKRCKPRKNRKKGLLKEKGSQRGNRDLGKKKRPFSQNCAFFAKNIFCFMAKKGDELKRLGGPQELDLWKRMQRYH